VQKSEERKGETHRGKRRSSNDMNTIWPGAANKKTKNRKTEKKKKRKTSIIKFPWQDK